MVGQATVAVKISDLETMLDRIQKSVRISLSTLANGKYLTISDMGSTDSHPYDGGYLQFGMYCRKMAVGSVQKASLKSGW